MTTVAADQLALHHLRLDEQGVQFLEHRLVAFEVLRGRRLVGDGREAQLFF